MVLVGCQTLLIDDRRLLVALFMVFSFSGALRSDSVPGYIHVCVRVTNDIESSVVQTLPLCVRTVVSFFGEYVYSEQSVNQENPRITDSRVSLPSLRLPAS